MPRKIKGVRRHGKGWQSFCRVNGDYRSESWPLDTPISEMTGWLKAQKGDGAKRKPSHKSFSKDAQTYLNHVTALPTYSQRVAHINLWVEAFAGRRRSLITSADIRGQRDRWLLSGLAPHTVNLRLRALSNLWTVLDGRRAPNPVREVPEATEPEPEPRSLPYWLAERIVDAFPTRAVLERAQAQLMITTGLAPVELSRLSPRHWQGATLFVQGRRKGAGGAARVIPLTAAATAALSAFRTARGWERLPSKQFYRLFRKACQLVADDPLVLEPALRDRLRTVAAYDLRHSYATALYRASGDAHAAANILGHRSKDTTARYIVSAMHERATAAITRLQEAGNFSGNYPPEATGTSRND
jgi:integrase